MDYCFVHELLRSPVFHVIDIASGFSATALTTLRKANENMKVLQFIWINIHGPPQTICTDAEFWTTFAMETEYFNINFNSVPARRQNKLEVGERKNSDLRLQTQLLFRDFEHAKTTRNVQCNPDKILRRLKILLTYYLEVSFWVVSKWYECMHQQLLAYRS